MNRYCALIFSSGFLASVPARAAAVDFSHQIVPILKEHCVKCHAGEKKKGGLSMNDRATLLNGSENGAVVQIGNSAKSRLIEVILSKDPDEQMPPKGARLSPEKIAVLRAWIDEGLKWEDGFAFKKPTYEPPLKPRAVELPPAVDGRTNPVDRIIDAYLAQHKVPRPAPLGDSAFLRRVSLDLIGLLPSPAELERFLVDKSADKRAKLVRTLLADDISYADHWLTFWNDLLRNDYGGTGFITGGRKQISGWLYQALVGNKPYDQFTRELIAPPTDASRGFIDGIKWRGEVSAGQTVEIQFAQSVSQAFLGINMKCASCHDSFIDRWKLDEAYGLAAIYSTRELDIARCDKPTGRKARASWLFPELGQVDANAAQPERLKQLAALMTSPQNGRFTRTVVNRIWHRLMGRGIVHPVDAMQTEPWSADLLDYLANHLVENRHDLKRTMELIATSRAYQSKAQVLAKGADDHGYVFAGPRAKRMTAEQFIDAVWQLTGAAPAKFDAPVIRGKVDTKAMKAIKPAVQWIWGDSAKDGRLPPDGESVIFRKNIHLKKPVTAAVVVATCDNGFVLYVNGRETMKSSNWQVPVAASLTGVLNGKSDRLLVSALNAGSKPNAAGLWLVLHVTYDDGSAEDFQTDSGWETGSDPAFSLKEGRATPFISTTWHPVTIVKPLPVWAKVIDAKVPALLAQGSASDPRMIRAALLKGDFLMRTLGRPNRDQIVSMRPDELSTLEAIDLANGPALADSLARGAKKIAAEKWPGVDAFVTQLFEATLTRAPTADELASMREALGDKPTEQALQDALWSVLMMPEFQFVR